MKLFTKPIQCNIMGITKRKHTTPVLISCKFVLQASWFREWSRSHQNIERISLSKFRSCHKTTYNYDMDDHMPLHVDMNRLLLTCTGCLTIEAIRSSPKPSSSLSLNPSSWNSTSKPLSCTSSTPCASSTLLCPETAMLLDRVPATSHKSPCLKLKDWIPQELSSCTEALENMDAITRLVHWEEPDLRLNFTHLRFRALRHEEQMAK